jgi:hypothetical protein
MYFPKFNMCTSLTEILHFPLSIFVLTSLFADVSIIFMQFMRDFALLKLNLCTSRHTSHSPIFVLSFIWYYHFLTQFMGLCTSQNLTRVLLKLRPRTSHYHCVYLLHFTDDYFIFPCNLRETHTSKTSHLYFISGFLLFIYICKRLGCLFGQNRPS